MNIYKKAHHNSLFFYVLSDIKLLQVDYVRTASASQDLEHTTEGIAHILFFI